MLENIYFFSLLIMIPIIIWAHVGRRSFLSAMYFLSWLGMILVPWGIIKQANSVKADVPGEIAPLVDMMFGLVIVGSVLGFASSIIIAYLFTSIPSQNSVASGRMLGSPSSQSDRSTSTKSKPLTKDELEESKKYEEDFFTRIAGKITAKKPK